MIAKSESKSNARTANRNRGAGGARGQSSNNRNRSTVFKQFLKALSRTKKSQKENKMPSAKQIMAAPEYIHCEKKKDVQCEITCLDIKTGSNDSLRLLVFKFSKNEKGDKNKGGVQEH